MGEEQKGIGNNGSQERGRGEKKKNPQGNAWLQAHDTYIRSMSVKKDYQGINKDLSKLGGK